MRNYFTLDGVDSRNFGVYISGQGTFNASGRDYNIIPVPGRNGDLVGPEKRFQNGTLVYPAFIYANFKQNIADFRNFLLSLVGYHDLIDSYHPGEIRKVLFEGPFEADVEPKNDAGRFDIEFNCKPQRYLASGNEVTTFDSAGETETLSGSIVTFDNPDVATVNALSTAINPIQDLHGYDSPWPAGGGKNKYDASTKETGQALNISDGGAYSNANWEVSDYIPMSEGYVTLSWDSSTNFFQSQMCCYDANKTFIADGGFSTSEYGYSHTFAAVAGTAYVRFAWSFVVSGTTYPRTNVRVNVGSSDLGYSPYSNICPISGWSAVGIERTGFNVWDEETVGGWIGTTGSISSSTGAWVSKNYISVKPSAIYYLVNPNTSTAIRKVEYDANKNLIEGSVDWMVGQYTPSANARYIKIAQYLPQYGHDVSINYPSTDHNYHAYAGNRYTIALGQTVYGGTLDVTAGKMYARPYFPSYNGQALIGPWVSSMDAYTPGASPTVGAQVVDMGGAVTEITIDPVTISAIAGQTNNVWANTGDITATIAFPQYQFTITNPTLFDSQPLLRVYGTGILGIGSQQITITQADVYTDIDCEMMDCFKGTSNKNPYVQFTDHNFPVLKPGTNNFSLGTGITKVEITPRWWRV